VETADLAVRLPDEIQYAACKVPDPDSDRWYDTVPESDWKTAVTLRCEQSGLSGWQVDEERFQPGDDVRFALRDPAQPDGKLPGIGRGLELDKSWRPQSLLDLWPCADETSGGGGIHWRTLLAVFASLAVMAIVLWVFFGDKGDKKLTAVAISFEVHPGQAVLLDFDTDGRVTGTRGRPFKVSPVREPSLGRVVVVSDRVLQYTAPEGKDGPDSFAYRVTINGNGTAPESVTAQVDVSIVNRPPTVKDSYRHKPIATNEQPKFDLSEVVRDDDIKPGKGAQLELVNCKPNEFGEIKLLGGLNAQFLPSGRPGKNVLMDCQVKDPVGAMADVPLIFDVVPPPVSTLPPIGPVRVLVGAEQRIEPGQLLRRAGHPELTRLTDVAVNSPDHGSARLDGGEILYTAPLDFSGTASFSYRATDQDGQHRSGTVEVQIDNQPPVLKPIEIQTVVGQPVTVDVTAYVQDADRARGQGWTLTVPPDPRFAVSGKSIIFTPGQGDTQVEWPYRITDQAGTTAEGRILVRLEPPKDTRFPDASVPDPIRVGETRRLDLAEIVNGWGPTWRLASVGTASIGVPRRVDDHTVEILAPVDRYGSTAFSFTATDAQGRSGTGRISLTVVNQPPTARDARISGAANKPIEIDLAGFVSDPDAAQGQGLRSKLVREPSFGHINLSNGRLLTFDPEGKSGVATAWYRVTDDAKASSADHRIDIDIGADDTPPSPEWATILQEIGQLIRKGEFANAQLRCREAASSGDFRVAQMCGGAFSRLPDRELSRKASTKFAREMFDLAATRSADTQIRTDARKAAEQLQPDSAP
jgi:hypothetical protein